MARDTLGESSFLYQSAPICNDWLEQLKDVRAAELILVGSGVTALEYEAIFRRAKVKYAKITPEEFLLHGIGACQKGAQFQRSLFLFAAPALHRQLLATAELRGLINESQFITFHQALRNRLVVDLRRELQLHERTFLETLANAAKLPTLGGVDIMCDSLNLLAAVDFCLTEFPVDLHMKAIFYPDNIDAEKIALETIENVEVNLSSGYELLSLRNVISTLVRKIRHEKKLYFLVPEEHQTELSSLTGFPVYADSPHEKFYDETLLAFEASESKRFLEQRTDLEKKCKSRRMYPVLDSKFKLKTCYLYDSLATTDYKYEDLSTAEFISARNDLCRRCIGAGLHRL
jgi:hypothetical protein